MAKALDEIDVARKVRLSIPLVATYLKRGTSQANIARICNISRQAVNDFIHTHADDLGPLIDKDDSVIANTFKHITNKTAGKITTILDEDMSKKDLVALNMIMGTTADKYRVFSNQSSLNVSVRTVVSDLEARKKELLDGLDAAIDITPSK